MGYFPANMGLRVSRTSCWPLYLALTWWGACFFVVPSAQAREVDRVPLTITLSAPAMLLLQVGSPGSTIDRVSFRVAGMPGSGAVRGESTGAYPVPFRAMGILHRAGTVTLTADSSQPLTSGLGPTIPFSQIYWEGGGDVPSGRFAGASHQIVLQRSTTTGQIRLEGGMAFFYDNLAYVPAGTYNSMVTYTLSTP